MKIRSFLYGVLGLLLLTNSGCQGHKTLQEQLDDTKVLLIQQDSVMEAEHTQLEAEHQQWVMEHKEVADTLNDSKHRSLEDKHTHMIQVHAEIIARHKKLLDDCAAIERRYQNKEMEDLAIQEQNKSILRDLEDLKKDHAVMKADHEKMKEDHETMLKEDKKLQ